jgi:hypothetical protein
LRKKIFLYLPLDTFLIFLWVYFVKGSCGRACVSYAMAEAGSGYCFYSE